MDQFFSWLQTINKEQLDQCGSDRNKLKLYKLFKGSFSTEPYVENVKNRNQRCWLSRMRISAHHLGIELGRYAIPPVPPDQRMCKYCDSNTPDTELHFLLKCETFSLKRQCFFGKLKSLGITFNESALDSEILSTILCPTSIPAAKCVNKYINILFKNRELIA